MRIKPAVPILVVSLAVLTVSQAMAQSTRSRVETLEQKVNELERLLQNGQTLQTEMLQTIQNLQKENQELRNQLDTLEFESERSADRQRNLYIDLDGRLQELESGAAQTTAPATGGAAGADDNSAYQAAFDELKAGNYEEAGAGFTAFLAAYEDSELRDNAQYWLAETLYVRKDFDAALKGFQRVIADYPASRKLPDAWLKIGYCNFELDKMGDARQALTTVIRQFPDSTAARLAQERLDLMGDQ
ncbi:MAG: tol-pal system protein YbgF [Gammaproteobacteria bacterium]